MRVVDTCVWIEIFADTPSRPKLLAEVPRGADEIIVPSIVILEVCKWALREARQDVGEAFLAFAENCVPVPLDNRNASDAAFICSRYKLATADAIVYQAAIAAKAELLTCDAHFSGLPKVQYIPKNGG
ncbi:MAG: type II toxin-antitoxin system VapC family toxin [Pseudomonadota bacterium]